MTVRIEKLAFGGSGLGYVDGKVCFVPFSAPGDLVRARITVEKRSYLEGSMIEVLEQSPARTTPTCPIFGICGGCNWQQLPYTIQLAEKQKIYSELLWRSGRIEPQFILPIISAPFPFNYRSRVQFKVRSVGGEIHLGFFKPGSHFVVKVPGECAIADSSINKIIPELLQMLQLFPEQDKVPQIDASVGGNGAVTIILHYIGGNAAETAEFIRKNRSILASSEGIYIQTGRKTTLLKIDGPERVSYLISGRDDPDFPESSLAYSPGGFSQVNYRQNDALVTTVIDWSELTGRERVLDIYCGNGNFSIPLAKRCKDILGIEEYEPSIGDARYNAGVNGVSNARFVCDDAVKGIRDCIAGEDLFDVVLLDPPRSGAGEIAHLVPSLKAKRIIYISCDPPTLARDIGILKRHGYDVVKSQPIDMFPQTYHIESVTLLVPKHTSTRS